MKRRDPHPLVRVFGVEISSATMVVDLLPFSSGRQEVLSVELSPASTVAAPLSAELRMARSSKEGGA
jgi:hypothetical protein